MMKHPTDACRLAVYALDIQKFDVGERVEDADTDFHCLCMRPRYWSASLAYANLEVAQAYVRVNVPEDLVSEREIIPERHRRDLRKIAANCSSAEQLIIAMPDDAAQFDFEETVGKVAGWDASQLDDLTYSTAQVMMLFARPQDRLELPTVPTQLTDFRLTVRPGPEHEFLAIPDASEPSDASKSARRTPPLFARPKRSQATREISMGNAGTVVRDFHVAAGNVDVDSDLARLVRTNLAVGVRLIY